MGEAPYDAYYPDEAQRTIDDLRRQLAASEARAEKLREHYECKMNAPDRVSRIEQERDEAYRERDELKAEIEWLQSVLIAERATESSMEIKYEAAKREIDEDAVLGDHNLKPSYEAEIQQLKLVAGDAADAITHMIESGLGAPSVMRQIWAEKYQPLITRLRDAAGGGKWSTSCQPKSAR